MHSSLRMNCVHQAEVAAGRNAKGASLHLREKLAFCSGQRPYDLFPFGFSSESRFDFELMQSVYKNI